MSYHLKWGLFQIISLIYHLCFPTPSFTEKYGSIPHESFILTSAYDCPNILFNHLSLEPEGYLVPKTCLFYCTLNPIPCHLLPTLISQFSLSFLASSIYSFLWMFPLSHKTYPAFLIIKQRTIESSGISGCQPIISFSFIVSFLTCMWYSHQYFLLVLFLINPGAIWQCLPCYLMCTWIIELLRIRSIWLLSFVHHWFHEVQFFFFFFFFLNFLMLALLSPFPLFYTAFQSSLRAGLGLFISSA